jgi:hypothetical protein
MGAGFIVVLRGLHVVDIDHVGMLLISGTAARLRILRGKVDPDAVLAWKLGVAE